MAGREGPQAHHTLSREPFRVVFISARVCMYVEAPHFAYGVDYRSVPDRLILEIDIVLDILGFSFLKGKLDLVVR